MKTIIIDEKSPFKHVCKINQDGSIIPVASFFKDYEFKESDYAGDNFVLVYAYKVFDNIEVTKNEVLDNIESCKHIEIYNDITKLDGSIETFPIDIDSDFMIITNKTEAHVMMTILNSYAMTYTSEITLIAPMLSQLAKMIYNKADGATLSLQVPPHFKEFVGVE